MMNVMRATELIGLPVVSIASGEDIAEIRDVVYDGEEHRLVGFTLNKRGFFTGRMKAVLPSDSVAGLGPDAVMVAGDAAVSASETPDAMKDLSSTTSIIGDRVLSADGNELGVVTGIVLAIGARARAVGYEVDPTGDSVKVFVPISAQMAVSGSTLILPENATAFIRNDLTGFGAAIASYRDSTLERGGNS